MGGQVNHPLVAKFRIKPQSKLPTYYNVFIFADRAAMHLFWREQSAMWGENEKNLTFAAQASSWRTERIEKTGKTRHGNNIGQVIFCLERLGVSIVSHEMTHLALFYVRDHLGKHIQSHKSDELIAQVQGDLTAKFYRQFWKRGIDKIVTAGR